MQTIRVRCAFWDLDTRMNMHAEQFCVNFQKKPGGHQGECRVSMDKILLVTTIVGSINVWNPESAASLYHRKSRYWCMTLL
jgi:hypothetical protein